MELKDTMQYVEGCFHDEPAACQCSCPFNLDIKNILMKASKGRWSAAYRDYTEATLFPVAASLFCGQKCLAACKSSLGGKAAVNLPAIEQACISFSPNEKPQAFSIPAKPQKIAVVGAGIAGLACALTLARKKYQITVFEKENSIGGSLKNDPHFEEIINDIKRQFGNEDVNYVFSISPSEKELNAFDAVYIASGKDGDDFGLKASWNSANYSCERKGWFLGGALCGMDISQSLTAGRMLSQYIEAFIQTGSLPSLKENKSVSCSNHMITFNPNDVEDSVKPQSADGFTKDEAKKEAARCKQCICDACIQSCEVLKKYKKAPFKLAADICGDANATPPFSNCEATREVYSCNLCSHCENVCPEGINIGELFKYSREDRWKQNKWVPGMHDYWLREFDFNMDEAFYASEGAHKYVFFPGCQLSAILPEQTLSSYEFLKSKLDTGIILSCCGAPAIWAGDIDRKNNNIKQLQKAFEEMGNPTIITACSSCSNYLKEALPSIKLVSIYEIISKCGFDKKEIPFNDAAIFSPCSAVKDDAVKAAVASIIKSSGCNADNLSNKGKCCGFGGHMKLANMALYDEISTQRISQSDKPYIVYCANCLDVFRQKGKEAAHVLELVFGAKDKKMPTLEEKRNNSLELKSALMKQLQKSFNKTEYEWDNMNITFSEKARKNMEDKLIRDGEIAEVIYKAEEDGSYFENENGLRIATLEKDVLTYWAEYKKDDDGFIVEYAYYHRMHIMG